MFQRAFKEGGREDYRAIRHACRRAVIRLSTIIDNGQAELSDLYLLWFFVIQSYHDNVEKKKRVVKKKKKNRYQVILVARV